LCNHTTEFAYYDGTNPGVCLPLGDCAGSDDVPHGEITGGICGCVYVGNVATHCVETVDCGVIVMTLP
jgi:hypothetical protein